MKKKQTGIAGILLVIALALGSLLLDINLFELVDVAGPGGAAPVLGPVNDAAAPDQWYELYFTNPAPSCPPEEERTGGVDEFIAEDVRGATTGVDVAAYDLDSEPLTNALIDLEDRGVRVRVVTDEDNGDLFAIRRLRRNGISVVEDKRSGLMHNKFIIIDGRYVWTGSLNFTSNGVHCNNNNLVRIDSPRLAANYLAEMDEMYEERAFGPTSPQNTPNSQLTLAGTRVENYFSPERELAPLIARAVAAAEEEILFMAFSFTNNRIGEAMIGRAEGGVAVRGVFETTGADTIYSFYPLMSTAGLPNLEVRTDGNGRIMHHKVIIIDRETVIFGSYNFSDSANERNDENTLIVHNPTFAGYFVEEFEAVWAEAEQ